MVRVISVMRPKLFELMLVAMTPRSRMLIRCFTSREKSVAMVIKPRPPIWMSTSITAWPKNVQYVPVSTTTSPVTQLALVAVKSAGTKPVTVPDFDEMGSISNSVPSSIIRKKPRAIVWTYVSCRALFMFTRTLN